MESVAPDRVPPRAAYHVHVRAPSTHNGVHNEIFIDASAPLRVEEHRYVCLTPCIYVHVMRYGKVLNLGSSCAR